MNLWLTNLIQILKKIYYYVVEIIYPNRCIFCGRVLEFRYDGYVCFNCEENSNVSPIVSPEGASVFRYNDAVKNAVHRFKYYGHPDAGIGFALFMYNYFNENITFCPDYIVPVPMYIKKIYKRGFNQTDIIADEFSKLSGIPVLNDLIIRNRNTKPQSLLSFEEKKENVKDAFHIFKSYDIKDKNILIIDDIYTSGATISECKRVILNAGAKNVYFLTFASAWGENSRLT